MQISKPIQTQAWDSTGRSLRYILDSERIPNQQPRNAAHNRNKNHGA